MIFSLVIISFFVNFLSAQNPQNPVESQNVNPYRHSLTLNPNYKLEWEVDWLKTRIHFNVTVATNGYVGFGLSKKGKMSGADIVIGGMDRNGKPYFSDRHAIANQLPVLDAQQNWTLDEAWERVGQTFLSFSRQFDTCDAEGDLEINERDLLSVIWAYGEKDDEILYHFENRGAYDLYLLDQNLTPQSIVDKTQPRGTGFPNLFEITEQITLPEIDTYYACSFHRVPTTTKQHIIGFDINFPSDRDRRLVHHLLLYRCTVSENSPSFQLLEQSASNGTTECYPNLGIGPSTVNLCRELIYAWGYNGRSIFFPSHVGTPMSESGPEYFLLQVHYDNPTLIVNANVSLSLEVYYTPNLRANDAAVMLIGGTLPGALNVVIPPSSLGHVINGHCSAKCTERLIPPEGINIFANLLHTHVTGRAARLRHFRGGKELPWVSSDDNYNFNYQQTRLLRKERKVLPGDQLIQRCVYDSTQRNGTVVTGGYSTREEMCLSFLFFYTRIPGVISCLGEIRREDYRNLLGIQNTTFSPTLREPVVTDPPQFAGQTVSNVLTNNLNWDLRFRKQIQEHHLFTPQTSICPVFSTPNGTAGVPSVMVNLEESSLPRGIPEYRPQSTCQFRGFGKGKRGGSGRWRNPVTDKNFVRNHKKQADNNNFWGVWG